MSSRDSEVYRQDPVVAQSVDQLLALFFEVPAGQLVGFVGNYLEAVAELVVETLGALLRENDVTRKLTVRAAQGQAPVVVIEACAVDGIDKVGRAQGANVSAAVEDQCGVIVQGRGMSRGRRLALRVAGLGRGAGIGAGLGFCRRAGLGAGRGAERWRHDYLYRASIGKDEELDSGIVIAVAHVAVCHCFLTRSCFG